MGIRINEDGMYVDTNNPYIHLGGAYTLPGGNYCDKKTYESYLKIHQKYLSPVALVVKEVIISNKPKTFH